MDFKAGLYDADGSPISGSSDLVIKIKRDVDDYFYDFGDSSFKSLGHLATSTQLSEPDPVNMPGGYEASIDVSGWNDGVYTAYIQYNSSPAWTDTIEFAVRDGAEVTMVTRAFKAGLYDANGNPISGSTDLELKVKRDADDHFYDFDDGSFKASGHVSISTQLSEPDAVNMPGEYEASVDVSGWTAGRYTAYIQYGGSPAWTDAIEFWISGTTDVILDFVFDSGLLFVSIRNISNRPVFSVSVQFDQDIFGVEGTKNISTLPLFQNIETLAPQKEILTFLDTSTSYFDRGEPTDISTTISYQDSDGTSHTTTLNHNLGIYREVGYIRKLGSSGHLG